MFRLATLGGLSLGNSAASDVAIPRRRLALLALLATAGDRGLSRDKLVAYFWPDGSADDARHSLEQLLYSVRQQLDGSVFRGTDPVSLNPEVITSDVAVFEAALARGADDEAVCAYTGDFLDGFYLNKASEFERWVDEQRARLRIAYGAALERIAEHATQCRDWNTAVAARRRLVALDRLSTRNVLGLVRSMAAAGDHAEALRTGAAFETLVREELGVPLDPSLACFLQELRGARNGNTPAAEVDQRVSENESRQPSARSLTESAAAEHEGTVTTAVHPQPRRRRAIASLVLLGAAVVAGIVWLTWPSPVPQKALVAVAAFKNRTGDPGLDVVGTMTADYIRTGLEQSELLEVDGRSFDAWDPQLARLEESSPVSRLVRSRAMILVSGAYDKKEKSDSLSFSGQAVDAKTHLMLFAFDNVSGKDRGAVMDQVRQRVVSGIAAKVDPALTPWAGNKGRPPVKFDAYQEFAYGMTAFVNGIVHQKDSTYGEAGFPEAAQHLRSSFRLDSAYYIAALWWFWARRNGGDRRGADSVLGILEPRLAAMSPSELALYDYNYAFMHGTPEERFQQDVKLVGFAPSSEYRYCLARDAVQAVRPRKALDVLKTLDDRYTWMRLMPPAPGFAVRAHLQLRHYGDAVALATRIHKDSPGDVTSAFPEIDALAALHRLDDAENLVKHFADGIGFPEQDVGNLMLYAGLRLEAASASRAEHARQLFKDALTLFSREPLRAKRDVMLFGRGRSLYYLGEWDKARAVFDTLARMPLGTTHYDWRAVIYLGALAARASDTVEVSRLRGLLHTKSVNPADEKYFEARTLAWLGQRDRALRFLAEAVKDGAQVWQVVDEGDAVPSIDPDFARLRGLRGFQKAVGVW